MYNPSFHSSRLLGVLTLLLVLLYGCGPKPSYEPLLDNTAFLREAANKPFYHGVASGDPYPESVLIWTRVSPEKRWPEVKVTWEVSATTDFGSVLQSGVITTGPQRDYTVKVIVDQLQPGKYYYYRFKALGASSRVGRTRTAPVEADNLKFAVVSCSNYEFGYFNGYAGIALEEDINAVLHLGDYIYEYGPGKYGDTTIGRYNYPPHEIISLTDYRDRYAQYRLDEDLQEVHAMHPFITIWDDHEITNNSYVDGAENHQPDEGDYTIRKGIARQVYYEWLPIREEVKHYRKFSFGSLADLVMLDERLAGRTQQPDSLGDERIKYPGHSLLGAEQRNWLIDHLKQSQTTWKLIGNQVIYSYCDWGYEGFSRNLDAWDGYPEDQKKIAEAIQDNKIENIIFLTGDTHTSWAFEATNDPFTNYNQSTGAGAFAIEFGTPSINSGNSDERFPAELVKAHEQKITNSEINPHLKYVNMRDHGYIIISVTPESCRADYKYVKTMRKRDATVELGKSFGVKAGAVKLVELERQ